jgi:glycosyltransferase involved in cell wall biosynthesis
LTILHVAAWWPNRVHPTHGNFVEKHVRLIAKAHDCTVVAVQEDPGLEAHALDAHISERDGYRTILVYYGKPGGLLAPFQLGTRVRAYLRAVRLARKHLPVPDVVHGHIVVDGGIIAAWLGRYWKRPVVISEHHTVYQRKRALSPVRSGLARWACRSARRILPVSEQLGRSMQEQNQLGGRYTVVSNVVDDCLFSVPANPPEDPPPLRLLHVSNFAEPHKNVPGILRVAAQLQRSHPGAFRWTLAGDGDHEWLRREVERVQLPDKVIRISGPHTETEVANLMQTHQAFVLFSRTENQPVVLLEAQCTGLPCVATGVGGIDGVIDDPAKGLLVLSEDEEGLRQALMDLLRDYARYNRKRIAEHARARYGEAAVLRQLDSVYRVVTDTP